MAEINQAPVDELPFEAAYERLLPEIDAFPDSELITINIDVPSVVTSALGAWPEIAALRGELVAKLQDFNVEQFDKLESYALATGHAHTLYMAASSPAGLQELGEQVAKARDLLHSDAVALAKRGMIDGTRLKDLKGPPGYKNMAFDTLMLVAMFREKWSELEGKVPLQANELKEAHILAHRLVAAVGVREQAPVQAAATAERRQRAFSLFLKAYDQARRAISYLRWEQGDMESIAPSLYAGRGNTKRRGTDDTDAPATPPAPPAPPVAQGTTGGSTATAAQTPIAGLPGGPAFTAS